MIAQLDSGLFSHHYANYDPDLLDFSRREVPRSAQAAWVRRGDVRRARGRSEGPQRNVQRPIAARGANGGRLARRDHVEAMKPRKSQTIEVQ